MSLELLRHVRQITEEQESRGLPMLVVAAEQDVDGITARLKESQRYKMAGTDALRANVKALAAKNLLNLAVPREDPDGQASLGKREASEALPRDKPAETENSFIRSDC